jgi:cation transport ATPase
LITIFSIASILLHLLLRFGLSQSPEVSQLPLLAIFVFGGIPLVYELLAKLWKREFGSDLLAGISIATSLVLGEYLAGAIVVLMLAGGEALENYALRSASSVLAALAKRMPSVAHRKRDGDVADIALDDVAINDTLVMYPHDICPVDGVVADGHGVMDESYLTGEPFQITKTAGSTVISGAINGESALTIRVTKRAADSRYAKIMEVMRESEEKRPQLRRLGDTLGAIYTPVALVLALLAWVISGDPIRFLAVLVIATPCPLLIAIPIAIIGSISLCARRAVLLSDVVDNSDPPIRPDMRPFSHRSGVCHRPYATHVVRHDPGRAAVGAVCPRLPHPQPAPSGAGASGTASSSRTVQRRHVSLAAIAGVRCRYRWR